jgi:hypothetical protein
MFDRARPILTNLLERLRKKDRFVPNYYRLAWLGKALLDIEDYAEAETLLLLGYEGIKQGKGRTIPAGLPSVGSSEAAECLACLYEATNQPDKAREWREKTKAKPPAAASASVKAPAEKPAAPAAEKRGP